MVPMGYESLVEGWNGLPENLKTCITPLKSEENNKNKQSEIPKKEIQEKKEVWKSREGKYLEKKKTCMKYQLKKTRRA